MSKSVVASAKSFFGEAGDFVSTASSLPGRIHRAIKDKNSDVFLAADINQVAATTGIIFRNAALALFAVGNVVSCVMEYNHERHVEACERVPSEISAVNRAYRDVSTIASALAKPKTDASEELQAGVNAVSTILKQPFVRPGQLMGDILVDGIKLSQNSHCAL